MSAGRSGCRAEPPVRAARGWTDVHGYSEDLPASAPPMWVRNDRTQTCPVGEITNVAAPPNSSLSSFPPVGYASLPTRRVCHPRYRQRTCPDGSVAQRALDAHQNCPPTHWARANKQLLWSPGTRTTKAIKTRSQPSLRRANVKTGAYGDR